MEDPKKFRIKSFELIEDYTIKIFFEDGKAQIINFKELNLKGWWKELEDPHYFNQVKLSEIKHLEWPNGQDFKPEHLYYWDKFQHYYL